MRVRTDGGDARTRTSLYHNRNECKKDKKTAQIRCFIITIQAILQLLNKANNFFFFFALVIKESQATEQAKEQLGRKGSGVLLDKMMNMTTAPNCSDKG